LEPGQKPQDRHDIIARVFQQKLKVMTDVLTKYRVFGVIRCYMYVLGGMPEAKKKKNSSSFKHQTECCIKRSHLVAKRTSPGLLVYNKRNFIFAIKSKIPEVF